MKKLVLAIAMSLVMVSCGNNINNTTTTKYESYELESDCYKVTYNDSILIYVDYGNHNIVSCEHGDTVTNRIENIIYKDIEIPCDNIGGTGKIGVIIERVFYHWKTKQVYMIIHNFNNVLELYDGESSIMLINWQVKENEVKEKIFHQ